MRRDVWGSAKGDVGKCVGGVGGGKRKGVGEVWGVGEGKRRCGKKYGEVCWGVGGGEGRGVRKSRRESGCDESSA